MLESINSENNKLNGFFEEGVRYLFSKSAFEEAEGYPAPDWADVCDGRLVTDIDYAANLGRVLSYSVLQIPTAYRVVPEWCIEVKIQTVKNGGK